MIFGRFIVDYRLDRTREATVRRMIAPAVRRRISTSGCRNTLNAMAANKRNPNVILGGGSCTTVALHLRAAGPLCSGCSAVTAQDINDNHRNSRYPAMRESSATPRATIQTTEGRQLRRRRRQVVVPSHGFRGVLVELSKELRPWCQRCPWSRGLEQGTNMWMSHHRGGTASVRQAIPVIRPSPAVLRAAGRGGKSWATRPVP